MSNLLFYNIDAIRGEYRRIDAKWLQLQYQAVLWLVVVAVALEVLMGALLTQTDTIVISAGRYFLKYLLVPASGNLLVAVLAAWIVRGKRLTISQKAYLLSLLLAVGVLLVYTIHSVFAALFVVLAIPLVLTVVYADQRLTAVTALVCIAGKALSDLFVFWDPERPSVLTSWQSMVNFFMSLLLLTLFYGVCCIIISVEKEKNEASIKLEQERLRMEELSVTDALTGVGNRQALRQAFEGLHVTQERECALVMMDLDDFKSLNDTFGHCQGDQYLRELGEALRQSFESASAVFRYGGDEFCALVSGRNQEELHTICAKAQATFAGAISCQACLPVSLSIGVAWVRPGETPVQLIARADQALYRAKREKGSICFES